MAEQKQDDPSRNTQRSVDAQLPILRAFRPIESRCRADVILSTNPRAMRRGDAFRVTCPRDLRRGHGVDPAGQTERLVNGQRYDWQRDFGDDGRICDW